MSDCTGLNETDGNTESHESGSVCRVAAKRPSDTVDFDVTTKRARISDLSDVESSSLCVSDATNVDSERLVCGTIVQDKKLQTCEDPTQSQGSSNVAEEVASAEAPDSFSLLKEDKGLVTNDREKLTVNDVTDAVVENDPAIEPLGIGGDLWEDVSHMMDQILSDTETGTFLNLSPAMEDLAVADTVEYMLDWLENESWPSVSTLSATNATKVLNDKLFPKRCSLDDHDSGWQDSNVKSAAAEFTELTKIIEKEERADAERRFVDIVQDDSESKNDGYDGDDEEDLTVVSEHRRSSLMRNNVSAKDVTNMKNRSDSVSEEDVVKRKHPKCIQGAHLVSNPLGYMKRATNTDNRECQGFKLIFLCTSQLTDVDYSVIYRGYVFATRKETYLYENAYNASAKCVRVHQEEMFFTLPLTYPNRTDLQICLDMKANELTAEDIDMCEDESTSDKESDDDLQMETSTFARSNVTGFGGVVNTIHKSTMDIEPSKRKQCFAFLVRSQVFDSDRIKYEGCVVKVLSRSRFYMISHPECLKVQVHDDGPALILPALFPTKRELAACRNVRTYSAFVSGCLAKGFLRGAQLLCNPLLYVLEDYEKRVEKKIVFACMNKKSAQSSYAFGHVLVVDRGTQLYDSVCDESNQCVEFISSELSVRLPAVYPDDDGTLKLQLATLPKIRAAIRASVSAKPAASPRSHIPAKGTSIVTKVVKTSKTTNPLKVKNYISKSLTTVKMKSDNTESSTITIDVEDSEMCHTLPEPTLMFNHTKRRFPDQRADCKTRNTGCNMSLFKDFGRQTQDHLEQHQTQRDNVGQSPAQCPTQQDTRLVSIGGLQVELVLPDDDAFGNKRHMTPAYAGTNSDSQQQSNETPNSNAPTVFSVPPNVWADQSHLASKVNKLQSMKSTNSHLPVSKADSVQKFTTHQPTESKSNHVCSEINDEMMKVNGKGLRKSIATEQFEGNAGNDITVSTTDVSLPTVTKVLKQLVSYPTTSIPASQSGLETTFGCLTNSRATEQFDRTRSSDFAAFPEPFAKSVTELMSSSHSKVSDKSAVEHQVSTKTANVSKTVGEVSPKKIFLQTDLAAKRQDEKMDGNTCPPKYPSKSNVLVVRHFPDRTERFSMLALSAAGHPNSRHAVAPSSSDGINPPNQSVSNNTKIHSQLIGDNKELKSTASDMGTLIMPSTVKQACSFLTMDKMRSNQLSQHTRPVNWTGKITPGEKMGGRRKCPFPKLCRGCRIPNCKKCIFCKDMKAYGGEGKRRQRCVLRVCDYRHARKNRCGNCLPCKRKPCSVNNLREQQKCVHTVSTCYDRHAGAVDFGQLMDSDEDSLHDGIAEHLKEDGGTYHSSHGNSVSKSLQGSKTYFVPAFSGEECDSEVIIARPSADHVCQVLMQDFTSADSSKDNISITEVATPKHLSMAKCDSPLCLDCRLPPSPESTLTRLNEDGQLEVLHIQPGLADSFLLSSSVSDLPATPVEGTDAVAALDVFGDKSAATIVCHDMPEDSKPIIACEFGTVLSPSTGDVKDTGTETSWLREPGGLDVSLSHPSRSNSLSHPSRSNSKKRKWPGIKNGGSNLAYPVGTPVKCAQRKADKTVLMGRPKRIRGPSLKKATTSWSTAKTFLVDAFGFGPTVGNRQLASKSDEHVAVSLWTETTSSMADLPLHSCTGRLKIQPFKYGRASTVDKALKTLHVPHCTRLHLIDVSHNSLFSDVSLYMLFDSNCCYMITQLDVSATSVGDDSMQLIAKCMLHLLVLRAKNCTRVSDKGMDAFSHNERQLALLDLSGCTQLTPYCLKLFTSAVGFKSLSRVVLFGCTSLPAAFQQSVLLKKTNSMKQRCRGCIGCLWPINCEQCAECQDRVSLGGPGIRKTCCIFQRCLLTKNGRSKFPQITDALLLRLDLLVLS